MSRMAFKRLHYIFFLLHSICIDFVPCNLLHAAKDMKETGLMFPQEAYHAPQGHVISESLMRNIELELIQRQKQIKALRLLRKFSRKVWKNHRDLA